MSKFFVAFDLIKDNTTFYNQQMHKELDNWGAEPIQRSVFVMSWSKPAEDLANHLKQFAGPQYRILVVEMPDKSKYSILSTAF